MIETLHPVDARVLRQEVIDCDYRYASGVIDVVEAGRTVRSCHFAHDRVAQQLRVACAIERLTYEGDAHRGRLVSDDRVLSAPAATGVRDIPHWLLAPIEAPIWGRPGEDWVADFDRTSWLADGVHVPLRAMHHDGTDGRAVVAWPNPYLAELHVAGESYLLRELIAFQPAGQAHGCASR